MERHFHTSLNVNMETIIKFRYTVYSELAEIIIISIGIFTMKSITAALNLYIFLGES
jgi:hypothetical protein